MEAGTSAFVSYVRGYKEHHCKFIFRIQDMSFGRLASSFALLRLPRMPETKKLRDRVEHFTPSTVDIDAIKFKDKAREKQRQRVSGSDGGPRVGMSTPMNALRYPSHVCDLVHLPHQTILLRAESDAAEARAAELEISKQKRQQPNNKEKPHVSGERLTASKRRQLQERDELQVGANQAYHTGLALRLRCSVI